MTDFTLVFTLTVYPSILPTGVSQRKLPGGSYPRTFPRSNGSAWISPTDLPSDLPSDLSYVVYPAEVTRRKLPAEVTHGFYPAATRQHSHPSRKIIKPMTKVRDTHKLIDACSIGLINSFSLATRLSRSSSYSHLSTSPLSS